MYIYKTLSLVSKNNNSVKNWVQNKNVNKLIIGGIFSNIRYLKHFQLGK